MDKQFSMKNSQFDIKKRTFQIALDTLKCCKQIVEHEKEYILSKQLSRSSTSVGANVREAQNAISRADFVHKLSIAQKECDESGYWIELLIAYIETENVELNRLLNESNELLKILSTIIIKTKENNSQIKR